MIASQSKDIYQYVLILFSSVIYLLNFFNSLIDDGTTKNAIKLYNKLKQISSISIILFN